MCDPRMKRSPLFDYIADSVIPEMKLNTLPFVPSVLCLLICVSVMASCAPKTPAAELILTNGVVWTAEPGAEQASAIAIGDGRILAVGTDAEVRDLAADGTREIDLSGRMVTPGFADNHTHFMSGGFQLVSVDLRDAATPEEFSRRIGAFARSIP